jgi:hypothetical protein
MSKSLTKAAPGQVMTTPPEALRSAWILMIERAAKDPAVDLAKLQRMLELRSAEHARQAAHTYRAAMAACQADVDPVRANCSNPQTRSRYADLAALDGAIRPVHTAHGFSLSFDTIASERPDYVRIVCKVYHSGGHCETHGLDVPVDGVGAKGGQVMTKVHALGSGCTYARRYLTRWRSTSP